MSAIEVDGRGFLRLNERLLRDPYPFYELVRAQSPAVLEPDFGVYLVGRCEDAGYVLRHPQIFSSLQQGDAPYSPPPCPLDDIVEWRAKQTFKDKLITNDPPDHGRHRGLINRFFTPRRIAGLEPKLREHSISLIDTFVAAGEVEFVSQYADLLPRIVIGELIGMPRADIDRFTKHFEPRVGQLLEAAMAPEATFDRLLADAAQGFADFMLIAEYAPDLAEYCFSIVADRKANPCGDIISELAVAKFKDGEDVALEAIVLLVMTLFVGGADSNTPSMLASSLLALARQPELQDQLRADPSLVAPFIEEVLRLEPPVQGLFRTALEDTEIGGVPIPKGGIVMVLFAAANRDERCFHAADQIDLHRPQDRGIFSFAQGVHLCPGAPLARMEGVVTVSEVVQRMRNIRLADPGEEIPYVPSVIQRTPAKLSLAFDPA